MCTLTIVNLEQIELKNRQNVKKILKKVLDSALLAKAWSVELAFVNSSDMAALNQRFRGKNYATDVLSFPPPAHSFLPKNMQPLGEIAICPELATGQAAQMGHSFAEEIGILFAHALLHLLGFDHEQGEEEARFQAECEMSILDLAGIEPERALIGRNFEQK